MRASAFLTVQRQPRCRKLRLPDQRRAAHCSTLPGSTDRRPPTPCRLPTSVLPPAPAALQFVGKSGKAFKMSYPCAMLNVMVADYNTNDQFQARALCVCGWRVHGAGGGGGRAAQAVAAGSAP